MNRTSRGDAVWHPLCVCLLSVQRNDRHALMNILEHGHLQERDLQERDLREKGVKGLPDSASITCRRNAVAPFGKSRTSGKVTEIAVLLRYACKVAT